MLKKLGVFVGVVVMGLLVGCGPVEATSDGEAMASVPQLSQEELAALTSETPTFDESMIESLAAACQPDTTNSCINAGYGACGNWSAYVGCGETTACDPSAGPACSQRVCNPERPGDCEIYYFSARYASRNRYRVCFNSTGQSCTEYEKHTYQVSCNCPVL